MTPSASDYIFSGSDKLRFWKKVDKTNSCWLWTGATLPNGYGVFNLRRKIMYVHRLSFFAKHDAISSLLVVDHICRVRNCVNPDHLREMDRGDNVRIGISHGSTITHCAKGHAFDEVNTRRVKARGSFMRVCAICHTERNRQYRIRKRTTDMVKSGGAIEMMREVLA